MAYIQKGYLCVFNGTGSVRVGGGIHYPLHRLIYENHHGVVLSRDQLVHHINGDKLDNRIENLEAVTRTSHPGRHITHQRDGERLCGKCYEWKPLDQFWKGQRRCKSCSVSSAREWRERNPDRVKAYNERGRVK